MLATGPEGTPINIDTTGTLMRVGPKAILPGLILITRSGRTARALCINARRAANHVPMKNFCHNKHVTTGGTPYETSFCTLDK